MQVYYKNIECENCAPDACAVPESNADVYCVQCETLATPGHGKRWVNMVAGRLFLIYFLILSSAAIYYSDALYSFIKSVATNPALILLANPIALYGLLPALSALVLGYASAWQLNKNSGSVSCKK